MMHITSTPHNEGKSKGVVPASTSCRMRQENESVLDLLYLYNSVMLREQQGEDPINQNNISSKSYIL
ncbi:hypothetical protein LINPERHAP2_LOCUS35583 [Linum perenne]